MSDRCDGNRCDVIRLAVQVEVKQAVPAHLVRI